jgi:hypothetical protein
MRPLSPSIIFGDKGRYGYCGTYLLFSTEQEMIYGTELVTPIVLGNL